MQGFPENGDDSYVQRIAACRWLVRWGWEEMSMPISWSDYRASRLEGINPLPPSPALEQIIHISLLRISPDGNIEHTGVLEEFLCIYRANQIIQGGICMARGDVALSP